MRVPQVCLAALLVLSPHGPAFAQSRAGGVAVASTTPSTADQRTVRGAPTAPVVAPLAALKFQTGGPGVPATGSLPVTVTSAGLPTASLALSCSIDGTPSTAFSIVSGAAQTLVAPATLGAATPIGVRCVRGLGVQYATVTCMQTATPGPNPPNLTAGVTCPSLGGSPNPGSVPAAPGPIAVSGPPNTTASATVSFNNVGGISHYTIACFPTPGFATSTTFPVSVPAGATREVSVSCETPSVAGLSTLPGTLGCTTSAAGYNPTFTTTCTADLLMFRDGFEPP